MVFNQKIFRELGKKPIKRLGLTMHKYLILLLIPGLVMAWTQMKPLSGCEALYFEYESIHTSDGLRYKIRFPKGDYGTEFDELPYTLNSIDNLQMISDEISKRSKDLCPLYSDLSLDINQCLRQNKEDVLISPEFFTFAMNVSSFMKSDINSCEELYGLELIGKKIEELSIKDKETADKSKKLGLKIIKLIGGEENKESVEMFAKCGGRKFSKDFIRNMIILTAREECMFPPPEGYLNFEQILKIANKISKDYDNKSILQINANYNKLFKEAYKEFARTTVQQSVADILGKSFNDPKVVSITNKSKNLKYLEKKIDLTKKKVKIKDKEDRFNDKKKIGSLDHLSGYVSEVFSTNTTFELADSIIETLLEDSIKPTLPDDMNNDGKIDDVDEKLKQIELDEKLLPIIKTNYKNCIDPIKAHLNLPTELPDADKLTSKNIDEINLEDQIFVNERLKLKCKYNPKAPICSSEKQEDNNSCNGDNVNYFKDKESTETTKIQACTYQSIFAMMPSMLDLLIGNTLTEVEIDQEIKFDKNLKERLAAISNNKLKKCMSEEIKKINGNTIINDDGKYQMLSLERTSSTHFTEALDICSDKLTDDMAIEVYSATINKMDIIQSSFKEIYPDITEEDIEREIYEKVEATYRKCQKIQDDIVTGADKEHKIDKKEPMLCMPLIEIEVASMVVENFSLDKMLELKSIKSIDEKHPAIENFKECKKKAYDKAMTSIGSKTDPKITNEESANKYLENDSSFFLCVSTLTQEIVEDATEHIYKDMITNKDSVTDKKFALGLTKEVQQKAKQCFKEKLEDVGSWTKLKEIFNASNEDSDNLPRIALMDISSIQQNSEGDAIIQPKSDFDVIINECMQSVEVLATTRIMQNEVIKQLDDIVQYGLLYQNPNQGYNKGDILALTAAQLRKEYNLTLPTGLKGQEILDWSFQRVLESEIKKNGKTDGVLNRYEELITEFTLKKVRENFLDQLDNKTKISTNNYKKFSESLSYGCVKNLYDNFTKKDSNEESTELKPEEIQKYKTMAIDYVSQGLEYLQGLGQNQFDKKIKEIDSFCRDSKNITKIDDIFKTTAFDFIIQKQINDKVSKQLQETIEQSFKDKLIELGFVKQYSTVTGKQYYDKLKNFQLTGVESHQLIKLRYALKEYELSQKALDKWIHDPKKLNSIIFNDDSISKYALSNIMNLIPKEDGTESDEMKEVSKKVMTKLFEDKSPTSFANDFTKAVVVGGVGYGGLQSAYDDAGKKAANKAIKPYKTEAKDYAQKFATRLWTNSDNNSDSVYQYLNWEQATQSQRNKVMNSLLNNGFIPAAEGKPSNVALITKDVTAFTQEKISGKSFEDRVTDYITPKTENAVYNEVGTDILKFMVSPILPLIW